MDLVLGPSSLSLLWSLLAALLGGIALGFLYFGGLWMTVKRLDISQRPGLLFATSFAIRSAVVIGGVYWLTGGHWRQVGACMLGFIAIRTVLTNRWGPAQEAAGKHVAHQNAMKS